MRIEGHFVEYSFDWKDKYTVFADSNIGLKYYSSLPPDLVDFLHAYQVQKENTNVTIMLFSTYECYC